MASPLIAVGQRPPRRGRGLLPWLGLLILRLSRWRISGELPDIPQAVVIAAPHTSNWDGLYGLAAIQALRLRISVLGKHSLFVGPLGWLLRYLGVIPVDRSSHHGMVSEIVDHFRRSPALFLAVAPEGTRHAAERWKTGFYQIAREARVPILMVGFDYALREIRILGTLTPGEDQDADMERIYAAFRGIPPCNPERLSHPLRS